MNIPNTGAPDLSGVYQDVYEVACNTGYQYPSAELVFSFECLSDGTWSSAECESKFKHGNIILYVYEKSLPQNKLVLCPWLFLENIKQFLQYLRLL